MDCTSVDLKKGSSGSKVTELQNYLSFLGLYTRSVDGDYGSYTVTAVKSMQKDYSCTVDGEFGPKTCKACGINGQDISNSIQAVEVEVFQDMIDRHDTFNSEKGREPSICYLNADNKYRYVTDERYHDMKDRYDSFVSENGREPKVCYINKASTSSSSSSTSTSSSSSDSSFTAKFKDAVGDFSTFKGAYNNIKYRGYIGYNNDIYDQETALKRLKNKSGLNCSDISQLLYALAIDMGLECRYVHIKCKSGTGHIVIDVRSQGASSWTRIDGAAALKSGYSYGSIWCSSGSVISYNDTWLISDDGVT